MCAWISGAWKDNLTQIVQNLVLRRSGVDMKKWMSEYGICRYMLTPTAYVNLRQMSYNLSEIVPEIGDHFFVSSHACDGVFQTSFPGGGVSRLLTTRYSLTVSWFSSSASTFLVFLFLNSIPSHILILFVSLYLILFVSLGVLFCSSFLVCQ